MNQDRDIADDYRAIHRQVLHYCRSVDRRDWAGIRSVYASNGWDHHTGFDGSADDYVNWLQQALPALDGSQHCVANHLCHLFGDEAVSETYGQAVHWGTPSENARLNFTSGFRYVDHWVRTGADWKIRERWALRDWTRNDSGRLSGTDEYRTVQESVAMSQVNDPFAALLNQLRTTQR